MRLEGQDTLALGHDTATGQCHACCWLRQDSTRRGLGTLSWTAVHQHLRVTPCCWMGHHATKCHPMPMVLGSQAPLCWVSTGWEDEREREWWSSSWAGERGGAQEMRVLRMKLIQMAYLSPESKVMSRSGLLPRANLAPRPYSNWGGMSWCLWLLLSLRAVQRPVVWVPNWGQVGVQELCCRGCHADLSVLHCHLGP